jgi:hypothetical protein
MNGFFPRIMRRKKQAAGMSRRYFLGTSTMSLARSPSIHSSAGASRPVAWSACAISSAREKLARRSLGGEQSAIFL